MQDMPDCEQMFRADENEKLADVSISRGIVEQEIDRLKSPRHQDQMKYIPEYLRNTKRLIVGR